MKKNREPIFLHGEKMKKMYRVMKLSVVLLMCCFIQISASVYSQSGTISVKENSISLSDLLWEIQRKTDFVFAFSADKVEPYSELSVDVEGSVEEVLDAILKDTKLDYEVKNGVYVITYKKVEELEQQPEEKKVLIKGTVLDDTGEPLPFVAVCFKGTTTGCISSTDGTFALEVPDEEGLVLEVSSLGFITQEIPVEGRSVINIVLSEDNMGLDEVVVVGFGSAKRERIGSAISEVREDAIEERAAGSMSIENVLGGQIKGLQISQTSGAPGAQSNVMVRGITSPFGASMNQPLYVIDGVPFNTDPQFDVGFDFGDTSVSTENPLLSISPDDIKSISVLKDAGATAIYGSRGANGVIIITTKRGQKNSATTVNVNYDLTITNPIKTFDVLDAEGFSQLHSMISKNTIAAYEQTNGMGIPNAPYSGYSKANMIYDSEIGQLRESIYNPFAGTTLPVIGSADVNWQDEVYRKNAVTHQMNINLSGGNESTAYSFSLSHSNQDAMMINDNLKRYGIRVNVDTDVSEWLKLGAAVNYSGTKNYSGGGSARGAISARPDYPVYNENGEYERMPYNWFALGPGMGSTMGSSANPVASLQNQFETNSTNFNGNSYVEIMPLKDLRFRAEINTGLFKSQGANFSPTYTLTEVPWAPANASLTNSISHTTSVSSVFSLNYSKTIGKHSMDFMGGYSVDRSYFLRESASYLDFPDNEVLTNAASALVSQGVQGGKAESGINSYFSRIQYTYRDKYTATANFRSDKSSKFGPDNQTAYFPSLALNWNMSREDFMQSVAFVNSLRLRGSIGKTGSANVADFNYLQFFSVLGQPQGKYAGNTAISTEDVFPNVGIQWETTIEKNVGIDFSLFSNRIHGSVDVYDKYTDGILMPAPFPLETGAKSYTDNLAEISNKGLEIEIGGDIIRTNEFNWSASFNIALNRNKVEKINGEGLSSGIMTEFVVGQPVGIINGYKVTKIIQEMSEIDALNAASPTGFYYQPTTGPGDYLYEDINNDGQINGDDRVALGSMEPDYFGGFSTNVSYKNFSLFAGFQYSVGNEKRFLDHQNLYGSARVLENMAPATLTDTWTPDNTDARYARLIYDSNGNISSNSMSIQDASYLRFKTLRFSYHVPEHILDKTPLRSLTTYVSAANLLTFTNYEGLDPEGGNPGVNARSGALDYSPYPFAKSFTFGVKVGF